MGTITVANKDWAIVSDVQAALSAARILNSEVFSAVTVTTSPAQAAEAQFRTHPIAIVRYAFTEEVELPEGVRGCRVRLELTIATKVNAAGADEADRLEEVLRLANAARNAVDASPPDDSCAWGGAGVYHRRIEWRRPEIDASTHAPWAVARVPLEIGFTLSDGSSH